MNDSYQGHYSANGSTQHVQASAGAEHDITLRVEKRDMIGELIRSWRDSGVITRFNEMQRGASPAITLALILASYAQAVRPGCYLLPELDEDTLRPMTGLGRASYYRAQQLLRAAGIMGLSKIPGRAMLFCSPEHQDRHDTADDPDLFAVAPVSPGARAGCDSQALVSPGARAGADSQAPVSPGARAGADSVSPGARADSRIVPHTYRQKSSCQSVLSDDDDDNARDGSDRITIDATQPSGELGDLLRSAGCRNGDQIEQAIRTPGLTPAAVSWCVGQAKRRLPDHPSKRPGLVLRMIADGDWHHITEPTDPAGRDDRREAIEAQQRQAQQDAARIDAVIRDAPDDELAHATKQAIDGAPNDFLRNRWAREPVPPADRILRAAVADILEAERMRPHEVRDPITDAAARGSQTGSPLAGF